MIILLPESHEDRVYKGEDIVAIEIIIPSRPMIRSINIGALISRGIEGEILFLDEEAGEYSITYVRKYFKDLDRKDILYIKRKRGAGTRILKSRKIKIE